MRTSLLMGSFLVIGLVGAASPADAQENPFDTTVDARMGRRVFRAECGRCHGRDAKGNDETGAPDLTTCSPTRELVGPCADTRKFRSAPCSASCR